MIKAAICGAEAEKGERERGGEREVEREGERERERERERRGGRSEKESMKAGGALSEAVVVEHYCSEQRRRVSKIFVLLSKAGEKLAISTPERS